MRLLKKIPLRPAQFVLFGDQILIAAGFLSAFLIDYRILSITGFPVHTILYRLLIHSTLAVTCWAGFRIYKKVIRFFSSKDYLELLGILLLMHGFSFGLGYLLPETLHIGAVIFIISFFITSFYIVTSRLLISYLYLHFRKSAKSLHARKVLIYGAGNLALFLKNSIRSQYAEEYEICGIIDDDPYKIGRSVDGHTVLDADRNLEAVIAKLEITDIIIASHSITAERKSRLLEKTLDHSIRVREFSGVNSVLSHFNMEKLASLDIHDLMNRESIKLFSAHVVQYLKGKTALVTGAAGSIGSEIVRKLSEHGTDSIICVDFSESALYDLQQELQAKFPALSYQFILADIRDQEFMYLIFKKHQPDIIYHAAAYKHVPLMEHFPFQAINTNVVGTWNIARLAIEFGAEKFVFVSSDKAVNPSSVMGATKRLAEMVIQSLCMRNHTTQFAITRFGNVLGSNGSVVPLFKKQIRGGGPVTVTHPEMTRYFMTIAEACQLVLEASVMAKGGEIFVFDMGRPVRIYDLAVNMIRLAGFVPGVDIQIEFIGQRPGEKLFEDLFSEQEKLKETHHEKIMISHESSHQIPAAEKLITRLQSIENLYEPDLLKSVIAELLPEFAGNGNIQPAGIMKNGHSSPNLQGIPSLEQ